MAAKKKMRPTPRARPVEAKKKGNASMPAPIDVLARLHMDVNRDPWAGGEGWPSSPPSSFGPTFNGPTTSPHASPLKMLSERQSPLRSEAGRGVSLR